MTEPGYSTPEVLRLVGVTNRQIDHWLHRGYISPSIRTGRQGEGHRWSEQDVRMVGRMAELVREGYRVEVAAVKARGEMVGI